MRFNVSYGYDVGGHLQAMNTISWLHPFFDLHEFYYATHPPLGYLLANTLLPLGITPVAAAQTVAFIASIAILLFLRGTLARLKLLKHPGAIAFLYITCNLPLQSYMMVAVNLDVIVFAWACVVLYETVRLDRMEGKRLLCIHTVLAGLFLAAGCLTKVSGFVALAIPPLYALVGRTSLLLHAKRFAVMLSVAAALVFPYYYVNYYVPEKTFFFNNTGNTAFVHEDQEAIKQRDADPKAFVQSLILPYENNEGRLLRTWHSLWRGEDRPPQSEIAERFILFYFGIMPWLVLLGLGLFVFRFQSQSPWHRFGFFLLLFSLLELLFLVTLIVQHPVPGYFLNKGIYIAPASLGFGFLLSMVMDLPNMLPERAIVLRKAMILIFVVSIFLFVVANNVVPVY